MVYVKIKEYACFESIEEGDRFYTTNTPNVDQTKLFDGTVAYKILGFADTSEQALSILYPTQKDRDDNMRDYFINSGLFCDTDKIDYMMGLLK